MTLTCLIMVKAFFGGFWQDAPRLVKGQVIEWRSQQVLVKFEEDKQIPMRYVLNANPDFVWASRCTEVKL